MRHRPSWTRRDGLPGIARGARVLTVGVGLALAGCGSGYHLPPANSIVPTFDARTQGVQLAISALGPATAAALIAPDGHRIPAEGISVLRGPYVAYNPPPSVGLSIGGFGFSGCCSAFGSGVGASVPVGSPTAAGGSDQWISSALIRTPPDYGATWSTYRVEVQIGQNVMTVPAPRPG